MTSIVPFLLPVAIIAYLVLRNPSSAKASKSERIDFIKQASDSIHGEEISVNERPALDSGGFVYEVVGEREDGRRPRFLLHCLCSRLVSLGSRRRRRRGRRQRLRQI